MRNTIRSLAAAAVIGTAATGASAQQGQAVQWRVQDGGNGHWYQIVREEVELCWDEAREICVDRGGHLATVHSAGEDALLKSMVASFPGVSPSEFGPWIGLTCAGTTWGAWYWVTGEPYSYQSWPGWAPNPGWGEEYVQYWRFGNANWNDAFRCQGIRSFLIEWSADCNNDGIVDYGQCRDGSLPDYNGNNIPDCCEAGTPCEVGSYPVQWRIEDGGNGHWYAMTSPGQNWHDCAAEAISRGGHLTTLLSAQETAFAASIATAENVSYIGARQDDGAAEPFGGWRWITGEPWGYESWHFNMDDAPCSVDAGSGQQQFLWMHNAVRQWDDINAEPWLNCPLEPKRGIIEWSADCNNDGIVDYGQILSGQLADADGNGVPDVCELPDCNADGISDAEQVARGELADYDGSGVPDCCESGDACVVGYYPVQWREADGGNGHWYMAGQTQVSWPVAQASSASLGGHLVTVTSAEELSFVNAISTPPYPGRGVWSGGLQVPAPAGSQPCAGSDCNWAWVTGEPWSFTAWDSDEPNDEGGKESRLEIRWTDAQLWNDEGPATTTYWIAEWSTDCNGDGKVDYGQILTGELADANADGIPDVCSRVPQDFATIQAAIDAAPQEGTHGIVVSAGTYAEAINLLGKGVRIIGAGPASTAIEAPAGLKTSVVRATGEPEGALIEGVTIRGGQTGTTLPGASFVRVGGGIFADESALALRNSVVESNTGGFGGGAYYRRCTGSIVGSTFRANEAGADGGGFQMIGGSMSVQDTIVEGNHANSRAGGIHAVGGIYTLRGVDIRSNTSGNIVGGLSFVWLNSFDPPAASLTVEDCSVTGNTALVSEGGIGILDATPQDVQVSISGTEVCGNLPVPNVSGGPWTDAGGNDICDCRTDMNLDGRVDGIDLATLLSQWGPASAGTTCDFNASGAVDAVDLSFMLAAWGDCGG